MEILTKGKGIESKIAACLEKFRKRHPRKFWIHMEHIKKMRQVLKSPDGMYIDELGRVCGIKIKVPADLYVLLNSEIEGFWVDHDNVAALQKVARDYVSMTTGKVVRSWQGTGKERDED